MLSLPVLRLDFFQVLHPHMQQFISLSSLLYDDLPDDLLSAPPLPLGLEYPLHSPGCQAPRQGIPSLRLTQRLQTTAAFAPFQARVEGVLRFYAVAKCFHNSYLF